jgi:hypothetical protein
MSINTLNNLLNTLNIRYNLSSKESQNPETPYLFCNEKNQQNTILAFSNIEKIQNTAHIGFSSWFNYDIIASRVPVIACICDIDENILLYCDLIKTTLLESTDRIDFVNKFKQRLNNSSWINNSSINDFYLPIEGYPSLENYLNEETQKQESFLSSDEKFQVIKTLYKTGRIYHLLLDACEQEGKLNSIKEFLTKNNTSLDTLYISNIYEWLDKNSENQEAFIKNMKTLIDPSTFVIDAFDSNFPIGSPNRKEAPLLRITEGKLPNFERKSCRVKRKLK